MKEQRNYFILSYSAQQEVLYSLVSRYWKWAVGEKNFLTRVYSAGLRVSEIVKLWCVGKRKSKPVQLCRRVSFNYSKKYQDIADNIPIGEITAVMQLLVVVRNCL